MSRVAALLLCCALGAVAVVAAPAPFPKPPKVSGPWYDGWDRPVDRVGDSRFERKGDRLTITLPGDAHHPGVQATGLGPPPGRTPQLLRNVEGDFAITVGLEGQVRRAAPAGYTRAGLVVTDGSWSMEATLAGSQLLVESTAPDGLGKFVPPMPVRFGPWEPGMEVYTVGNLPVEGPVHLQLRRRGDKVLVAWGPDYEGRTRDVAYLVRRYPRRLKVGVYATSNPWDAFKAEFVNVRLSRGGK